jgi:hypothetical protein
MPIPSKKDGESPKDFMSRCMGDSTMNTEYPDQSQRSAVCMSKACEGLGHIEAADFQIEHACELAAQRELERAASEKTYKYKDPKTGEVYEFNRRGIYRRNGRVLVPVH